MRALRPVSWFFFKVCAIYALFLVVDCGGLYAAAFRAVGNGAFANMGDGGRVRLSPAPREIPDFDTQVTLINTNVRNARGTFELATRKQGYLPMAFTIALIVATPIPLKRRALALVMALAAIGLIGGFQFYLRFVNELSQPGPLNVYHLTPFIKGAVRILIKTLSLTPVTSYIVPVVIWAAVIFRRSQFPVIAAVCRGERPRGATAPAVKE